MVDGGYSGEEEMNTQPLKVQVRNHIQPILTESELSDYDNHTDNNIATQREFLKRLVVERAEDPMQELDCIEVINTLSENSICPFINGHLAKEI